MKNYVILLVLTSFFYFNCGSENKPETDQKNHDSMGHEHHGLSDFELENGIGPIKQKIDLPPLNKTLAKDGEKIFSEKCASCHKLDERYVGPAKRDILKRRTPEYVMNMILNPEEMSKVHPEAKKMLAEYLTPMPFQNVTVEDAQKLLEYFRLVGDEK